MSSHRETSPSEAPNNPSKQRVSVKCEKRARDETDQFMGDNGFGLMEIDHSLAQEHDEKSHYEEVMVDTTASADYTQPPTAISHQAGGHTTTRLVIKDIEVENFKSYAGVHRIGPFHKTFTATIGPNGSGKSNVIDAMLFVFGKNAKKIRLDKLSELIHNSAAHPNLNRASVQVNFVQIRESEEDKRNPSQRLVVPGSELSICREVHRSNQSQYYINGKRKTQKDVIEILTCHGIDLDHNRFLILQGEVEQIALMKPKSEKEGEEGLVEYFDDLIGSNSYLQSIKDASRIVEDNQDTRLNSLDALRKVQGERDAVASAKDTTMSFIRKDNHLQKMITVLCQLKIRTIEEKLVEPREKVKHQKEAIDIITKKKSELEENLNEVQEEEREIKKTLDTLFAESEQLKCDKRKTETELEKVKVGCDENDNQRKKETDKMKKLQVDLRNLIMMEETASRELEISEVALKDSTEEVKNLQPIYDKQTDDLQAVQKPLLQELARLKKELAPFNEACTKADQLVQDGMHKIKMVVDLKAQNEKEILQHESDIAIKSQRLADLEEMINKGESGQKDTESLVSNLGSQLSQVTRLKYSINAQITNIKNEHRDTVACDKVMDFLSSQNLPKYYGTLRQLGRIADEYDISAGVASNCWGFHVVEDDQTAQKAVQLLKQNGMRATMMVLQRIEKEMHNAMTAPFQCHPKSQRLYDLIKPQQPKFASVFYQAVRNTLVVKDLATAREVAFNSGGTGGRHRVVTVDGSLIERTGAVTGGGRQKPQGAKLKCAHAPADREATRAKLEELQKELQQAVENENNLQEQIHQITSTVVNISPNDIRRMRMEVVGLKTSIAQTSGKLIRLRESALEMENECACISQYERQVRDAEAVSEKAQKDRIKHASAVTEIEEKLQNVGGPEFRTLQENLKTQKRIIDEQTEKIKHSKKQIQKAKASKVSKENEMKRTQESIDRIQAEADETSRQRIVDLEQTCVDLSKTISIVVGKTKDVQGTRQGIQHRISGISRDIHNLDEQRDDHVRSLNEEQSKMQDELSQIGKLEARIGDAREKVLEYVSEFGVATLESHDACSRPGQKRKRHVGTPNKRDEEYSDQYSDEEGNEEDENTSGQNINLSATENDEFDPDNDANFDKENFTLKVSLDELDSYNYDRCTVVARELMDECKRLKGTINFEAVEIWRQKQKEYKDSKAKYDNIVAAVNKAESDLEDLTKKRKEIFMSSFKIIQKKLKEMYQLLAHGGDADVNLVDSSDPYEGVNFTVRPPKKSWKQVSNLSGGEKTLSSLALVFALHHIKPTPIYVMDEIDAALDFRNVSIVGRYVLEQAQGAQFLIISLRNNMFELAHQLVGICKVNDQTRSLTLNPSEMSKRIEAKLVRAAGDRELGRGALQTTREGEKTSGVKESDQSEAIPAANGGSQRYL